MRWLITAMMLSLSGVSCFAGVGESVAACKASYGDVVSDSPPTTNYPYRNIQFKHGSLLIVVDFRGDKAERIAVVNSNHSKISPQEKETWLNTDSARGNWTPVPDSPKRWTRANGDQATLVEPLLPEFTLLTYDARTYLLSLTNGATTQSRR